MAEPYQSTSGAWPPQAAGTWTQGSGGGSHPVAKTAAQGDWRRWSQIGVGHAAYAGFNWCFDHVLYVYVVYRYGMLQGGAIMTALSCLQCATTLVVYQRMGIDWVGAGFLSQLRTKTNLSLVERLLVRVSQWSPAAMFAALCVLQDPFITTAYFREGRFGPLARSDWRRFVAAVLISNLYWILVASAVGNLLAATWRLVSNG